MFYIFFSNISKGTNNMLDLFKDYAKEVGYNSILGDSLMIVIAILGSVYFLNKSINFRFNKFNNYDIYDSIYNIYKINIYNDVDNLFTIL